MTDDEAQAAQAAHERWSTDRSVTTASLATELGVPTPTLYSRWVALGLTSRRRHALRGLNPDGQIPMAALRAAWEQYPKRSLYDLADEMRIHPDSLRHRWRGLGWSLMEKYNQRKGRSCQTVETAPVDMPRLAAECEPTAVAAVTTVRTVGQR